MGVDRLRLYHLDMKYVRSLAKADERVMSVSPQIGKSGRPFVGVVFVLDEKRYCIPLSSPKPKHERMKADKDFSKIIDKNGRLIGVLNFNNMIPVDDSVLLPVDLKVRRSDDAAARFYKGLLNDQLDWCNENRESIARKASKLYRIVVESPECARSLVGRCCDFRKLEEVLANWH